MNIWDIYVTGQLVTEGLDCAAGRRPSQKLPNFPGNLPSLLIVFSPTLLPTLILRRGNIFSYFILIFHCSLFSLPPPTLILRGNVFSYFYFHISYFLFIIHCSLFSPLTTNPKGSLSPPKRMNFRKISERPLTPPPAPFSENFIAIFSANWLRRH